MAGAGDAVAHCLQSPFWFWHGGYLVRNNGDQVEIETLKGKNLGLYFSAAWCGPCQRFTPCLVDVYDELSSNGDFEVIFVSADDDEESFQAYFSKMPWLAVPFSDAERRDRLDDLFKVRGIPHLIILDKNGKVSTDIGVDIVGEFGAEGYPFTPNKINQLVSREAAAKRDQSLRSIMLSHSRDYVISAIGEKVPVTELEGKVVGFYFSMSSYEPCVTFTPKLVDVYEKLKENGEIFEIVQISIDQDEEFFEQGMKNIPWFSLPFRDKRCDKLIRYFDALTLPILAIIGQDGKTLHSNVAEAVEEHGIQAYPFTKEKIADLEKAKEEAQTLESLLVLGDLDFVIGKDGAKIPVSSLVGKNILLYFSADWCPPCRSFLPKLIEAYDNIKAKDDGFEVIFISSDRDELSFDNIFSRMPWLAVPFGDPRKAAVMRKLKGRAEGILALVAIGTDGRTAAKDALQLISAYGAKAYPFTAARVEELQLEIQEMAKNWPQTGKHALHEEHQLLLSSRTSYICDGCEKKGRLWSYCCEECDFDLHPKCALENIPEYRNGHGTKDEWSCCGG